MSQLTAAGMTVDSTGKPTNSFVAYDAGGKTSVTLGTGTVGAQIHNLVAGTTGTDAINLAQLNALGATIGTDGKPTNSFVAYSSTSKDLVTLAGSAGTKISNVLAGTSATDAVNMSQLTAAGMTVDSTGKPTNSFVAYDAGGKTSVTLGSGTVGAQIHQVVDGTADKDAVNLGQMNAALASAGSSALSVSYDSASKNSIKLGDGTNGAQIHNLVAGTTGTDAINLAQLNALGATIGTDGKPTNSFVAYDAGGKTSVTLGDGTAGAQIHNLVAGTTGTDAINLAQLNALGATIGTDGKPTNSFVAYSSTSKDLVTLAGSAGTKISNVLAGTSATDAVNMSQLTAAGMTVDSTGKPTNSFVAYDAGGKTSVTLGTGTVGAQIHNLVAGTTGTDAINLAQLNALGATIGTDGKPTNSFVAYSNAAKDLVTLAGSAGTKISNLAAGTTTTDAVNFGQLQAAGLNIDTNGKATNAFVAYDDLSEKSVTMGKSGTPVSIKNVADGVDPYDAVNKEQLDALSSTVSTITPALKYLRFGSTDAKAANALGTDSLAIGGNAYASQTGSLAFGRDSVSSGVNSLALGLRANAGGKNSVALGQGSSTDEENTVSVGNIALQRNGQTVVRNKDHASGQY